VVLDQVKSVVASSLRLGDRISGLAPDAPLLGAIPELDSMAVVQLITAVEEHFGISVADDEIDASAFSSLASLAAFVETKLAA